MRYPEKPTCHNNFLLYLADLDAILTKIERFVRHLWRALARSARVCTDEVQGDDVTYGSKLYRDGHGSSDPAILATKWSVTADIENSQRAVGEMISRVWRL